MDRLTVSACRQFIQLVTARAEEMRVPVSVAVVSGEGHLIALERMDGAGFLTAEIAWSKAFTVAAFRSISPRFADGLVIQQWFRERNPQMLINASVMTGGRIVVSGGCAPVFAGDELVGAYGISGGTSGHDEEMGRYAREAMGWRHRPEHDDTPDDVRDEITAIYHSIGLEDQQI